MFEKLINHISPHLDSTHASADELYFFFLKPSLLFDSDQLVEKKKSGLVTCQVVIFKQLSFPLEFILYQTSV